jgi:hypothetical protein
MAGHHLVIPSTRSERSRTKAGIQEEKLRV